MKSLVLFVCGGLLFGAVALGLGVLIGDQETLLQGAVAFGLTFIPAAGTLAWVVYTYHTTPQLQLMASLGGSGLRMAVALGGGLLLTNNLPQTFDMTFWYWLILFYLGLLAFEITLLVRQQAKDNPV